MTTPRAGSTPAAPPLNIVVGVTGGIAAYKAVGVIRELVKLGHDVHVIATEHALRFVGAPTLEAISRNPLNASLFDGVSEVRHVSLGQRADLIVIAPATANTLAKLAAGIADDLLGTTVLASRAPVVVAPAMHTEMWENPATVANVALLRSRGIRFVGPDSGMLTGPDSGVGRMSEPEDIVAQALSVPGSTSLGSTVLDSTALDSPDLAGLHVVITAGGTREPLDPVRFLGNRSSGKQGLALAGSALDRGAHVTLIAAHLDASVREAAVALASSHGLTFEEVETATQLRRNVLAAAETADAVIMAAAVADYRPAEVAQTKIKKDTEGDTLTLTLVKNPDILAELAANKRPEQTIIGFAAETAATEHELLDLGRAKAKRKGADLLVLNMVGWNTGFGSTENSVIVITAGGDIVSRETGTKQEVADSIMDALLQARDSVDLSE